MIPSRPSYVAAALLLAVLPGCHHDPAPAQQMAGPDPLIARGEYLVRTSGCNDCHTSGYPERQGEVPVEQWLTGSPLGYHGPWGTTYATNLRLRMQELDEPQWLQYSGNLRTRPLMPDFALRAMSEDDRRAIYRFVRSLGAAGEPVPQALPPGVTPPEPYLALVAASPPPRGPTGN